MTTILVVDDEKDIVEALKIYLLKDDYEVLTAYSGKEAIGIVNTNQVDLILMDIMMPEVDGLQATKKIREFSNAPIIFLTAKSEKDDVIEGLDSGGDDYVTKPFNYNEVKARIRAQLRRYTKLGSQNDQLNLIVNGGIEIDKDKKSVEVDGNHVNLTAAEYDILLLLASHLGRIYSIDEIYQQVWGQQAIVNDRSVAVHVRHLREKIEIDPSKPRYIKVVWGQGYKMENFNE